LTATKICKTSNNIWSAAVQLDVNKILAYTDEKIFKTAQNVKKCKIKFLYKMVWNIQIDSTWKCNANIFFSFQ
jgi:hypothetical protein